MMIPDMTDIQTISSVYVSEDPLSANNTEDGQEPADVIFSDNKLSNLYYITCAFGVFGNIVAMIVLLSAAQLRRMPMNLFFTHQSFIDCIVCCITIVEEVTLVHYNGPGVCHFIYSKMLSNVTQYASSYNLTILTVVQHFAIVSPMDYMHNRDKVAKRLAIVFIAEWVLCFCSLLFLPFTTVFQDGHCYISIKIYGTVYFDLIPTYSLLIAIVIPVTVMLTCYARMLYALYKSSNSIQSTAVLNSRAATMNLFQTCFIMLIVFLGCWLTMESAIVMFIIGVYPNLSNDHYNIGHYMVVFNSAVNPYIYLIRYKVFTSQLKNLLGCR